MDLSIHWIIVVLNLLYRFKGSQAFWSDWWSYMGVSGPEKWHINTEWMMCAEGKHQSPINVDPKNLLFDPKLKPIKVDSLRIPGHIVNTGHDLTIYVNSHTGANISAGPLSYKYKVEHIKLHFGNSQDEGSEHTIANKSFPAEMQIYAYNTDLYKNFSHASKHSQGLVAISVFIEVGETPRKELLVISKEFINVRYKNWAVNVTGISIGQLLPDTEGYITYDGSQTQPGCLETVTWIIMNKPIYITKQHMTVLRKVHGSENESVSQWPMAGNRRPAKPLYHRTVRTNINFPKRTPMCNMEKAKKYKVNKAFQGS